MRENILMISHNTHTFFINDIKYASNIFKRVVVICPYNGEVEKSIKELDNVEILYYYNNNILKYVFLSLYKILEKKKIYELCDSIKNKAFSIEYIKRFLFFIAFEKLVKIKFKKLKLSYDESASWIFYSAWYYATAYAVSELKLKYKFAKTVTLAHSFEIDPIRNKYINVLFRKQYHNNLDRVCFISYNVYNSFKENIAKPLGLSLNNTEVRYLGTKKIFNGISHFSKDGCLRIVSCSNMIPIKRVDLIFMTLDDIRDIPIEWVHFGDGSEMNYIRDMVKNKKNHNLTVKLTGSIDNAEIHKYYISNNVDIFINVSKSEGIPVSIMEAMSYGIPIIATDVGGNSEIVNNDFGILISSNPTIKEIKESILELINLSDEEKRHMQKNALSFFEMNLNSDILRRNFFTMIQNI